MFFRIFEFISYVYKAKSKVVIHSPFVYKFYSEVIKNKRLDFEDSDIEKLWRNLKNSKKIINVNDLGTGSGLKSWRKISSIARKYSGRRKDARLISRIIRYFKPNILIELGTSLGYTTIYMAKAAGNASIYTLEGCRETSLIATENFNLYKLNIETITGNIDQTLESLLNRPGIKPDFVFFDANHTYEATVKYFEKCLEKATENSVFVFDDIYWSKGMKKAWIEIAGNSSVSVSIDLYHLGIVFFRKNIAKQHFVLKY